MQENNMDDIERLKQELDQAKDSNAEGETIIFGDDVERFIYNKPVTD
jgi:hypothetical protein